MPPYTNSELERTREVRLFDANPALQLPQRVLAACEFCPVRCDGLRKCWRSVISAQCIAIASEGVGAMCFLPSALSVKRSSSNKPG